MPRDDARPQRQDPHVRAAQLVPQRVREALLAGFVGVVDGLAGEGRGFEGGRGRDVEDGAAATGGGRGGGEHGAVEDGVRGVHVAGDVGGVHGVDCGDGEGVEGGGGVEGEAGLVGLVSFVRVMVFSEHEVAGSCCSHC